MAHVTLVTGGCRSGKSAFAQRLAESLPGPRTYVATCPVTDEEMRRRIEKHRAARAAGDWTTLEQPLDLERAILQAAGSPVVLVDCLTLWVSNLMHEAEQAGKTVSEEDVVRRCRSVLAACGRGGGNVLFVTNEVGMGIVPDNALARRYRDLAGRCNQTIAAAADAVVLMSCGIPLFLKGSPDGFARRDA
jgi:adenosylcobinamide kinase/adenosylcobinamide-phosphate guanylyltransferase